MKKLFFIIVLLLPIQAVAGLEEDLAKYEFSAISNVNLVLSAKEKAALELAKAFTDKNAPTFLTENGRITFAYGLMRPSIIAAPFKVTDIELEEGEFVNEVVIGDNARWKLTLARSGSPETNHLLVKPMDTGLDTSLVITTSKRVYHLELRSQTKDYMSYVGFVYPEDAQKVLASQIAEQKQVQKTQELQTATVPILGQVELSKLDFEYTIKGEANFKPVQVFNDGRQVFIKLPEKVKQAEMPVLLVRRSSGADALVNYRISDTTIVVDELFQEAVLLAGVGRSQEKIIISR